MSQYRSAGHARISQSGTLRTARTDRASAQSEQDLSYDELYEEARRRGLKGRSKMSKTELERALAL